MFPKIMFSIAMLFAVIGGYNMVWKDRLWLGVPIRTRHVNLAWFCFFWAAFAVIVGYLAQ